MPYEPGARSGSRLRAPRRVSAPFRRGGGRRRGRPASDPPGLRRRSIGPRDCRTSVAACGSGTRWRVGPPCGRRGGSCPGPSGAHEDPPGHRRRTCAMARHRESPGGSPTAIVGRPGQRSSISADVMPSMGPAKRSSNSRMGPSCRSPSADAMIVAVSTARTRVELHTASKRWLLRISAASLAWARPTSLRGGSPWPVQRCSAFQVDSPCLAT